MPAAIPLIVMGVSAVSGVVAAKQASNASKRAAQVQVDASNKGMDYQQQSQRQALDFIGQQQNRPTQPMGGAAFNQLSSRTGGGAYGGLMGGGQPLGAPTAPGGGYQTLLGQPPGGGMVMLEAPTGERKSVPEAQAQALIQRGARRV